MSDGQENQFTSTGQKLFCHKEVMNQFRNGVARPIVAHIMPTDLCNHSCAFCSVLTRIGSSLKLNQIKEFIEPLKKLGLKAVIISGGGNPILYRDCQNDFNTLINYLDELDLEIGLITNGLALKQYRFRKSWKTVKPESLDKCKWIRISMAGLDHSEKQVFVPDIDPLKTTLGFSYIYHDIYYDSTEKNHGKVSTSKDLITPLRQDSSRFVSGKSRFSWLRDQIHYIVETYKPKYVRLLPNCLEPEKISERCAELEEMARQINPKIVFVQYKQPKSPDFCYLGYFHPVLNSDGYVYPCDSCVLNGSANHMFAEPWRICKWNEIDKIYNRCPAVSLIKNPYQQCPDCVFSRSNNLLMQIQNGHWEDVDVNNFEHPNFI